jgi:hypothetical protein
MAKPLPVDVVTSTWDIIGVIANVVAGVGAAGALLIAALAYLRQVNDAQVADAAKVVIRVDDVRAAGRVVVLVENHGSEPMYEAVCVVADRSVGGKGYLDERQVIWGHDKWVAADIPGGNADLISADMWFVDASNRAWRRTSYGALRRFSNRDMKKSEEACSGRTGAQQQKG